MLPFEIPQPRPWQPGDDELDPTVDVGWDRAADHELVAIRPEDIPPMLEAYKAGQQPPLPPVGGPRSWAEGAAPVFPTAPAAARAGAGTPPARFDWEVDPTGPEGAGAAAGPAAAAATFATYPGLSVVPDSGASANLADIPQAPAETALAPSDRRWRRASRRAKAGLEAAARPILVLALFALGTSIGWTSYLATRPVPQAAAPAAAAVDAGTTTDVPPQILSLITALNADDQNQVQTVVPAEPYRLLAGELAAEGVKTIRGASALQTFAVGRDSVTQILIRATSSDGSNFAFNLVVHLQDGVITEFR
jgi:hypothetical protein